jgi:hypothetical protein
MPTATRTAAIFDFDGTIIAGYSILAFLKERVRRRELGAAAVARTAISLAQSALGQIDSRELIARGMHEWSGRPLADLEARRQKQLGPTRAAEREAYRKYARVWNASGAEGELDESLRLAVSFARTWSPVDRREHQEVAFKDIAAGYMSPIDYRAEAYGETRDQAIAAIERAREDLERYPWAQNPAAMTDGPHAPGVDATPVRGAPRPDVSSAVEGASTLAAVLTAQDAS